ncbi:MAG: hypothetical protein M3461_24085 [Pseudomonadota bacterium]|nr:hypothetical protein [Pseudomonadota bacterium]
MVEIEEVSHTVEETRCYKQSEMKLPNANLAIIEEGKVIDYLLNQKHRFRASKARFFARFGFPPEKREDSAAALRKHGRQNKVTKVRETGLGSRYEVEGELTTPDGRRSRVRTVWQVDDGEIAPRLITAYPLEEV